MSESEIRELDPQTVERIAAGEVVERPASVVKELVENSIDAGASRVTVAVEAGGTEGIRVSDDGVGMSAEALERAIEKHTTSKISDIDDLESGVATLGFRGEALHAIAAVSRLTITSRPADGSGTELVVEGGEVTDRTPAGRPVGTTVEVRDLFYNVPARRKYLKQDATEFAHVNTVVTSYALANPDVAVTLEHDGRETFATTGTGSLREAVLSVYGREVAEAMRRVDGAPEGPLASVEGLVSHPETTRASREYLSTFVNGRYVTANVVREAIVDAYDAQLAPDRYPFAVLFLEVDPATVDVNVHPRKLEIRFAEEEAVREQVRGAVEASLLEEGLLRSAAPRGRSAPDETAVLPESQREQGQDREDTTREGRSGTPSRERDGAASGERDDGVTGGVTDGDDGVTRRGDDGDDSATERRDAVEAAVSEQTGQKPSVDGERRLSSDEPSSPSEATADTSARSTGEESNDGTQTASTAASTAPERRNAGEKSGSDGSPREGLGGTARADSGGVSRKDSGGAPREDSDRSDPAHAGSRRKFRGATRQERLVEDHGNAAFETLPAMRILGQFRETYIVAETADGLVLIDQHAADERINYERLKESFAGETTTQALAEPVSLELTAHEAALFEAHSAALSRLGFHASLVDDRHVEVRTVPAKVADQAGPELIRDVLGEFVRGTERAAETVEAAVDELLADLACYPSVTGNTSLTEGSVVDLLSALDGCENPYACPHGRPVLVELATDEIDDRFERDYPGHG